jgi:hypothetical protein
MRPDCQRTVKCWPNDGARKCHAVSDGQARASADLPSFDEIAARYGDSHDAFKVLLADPHPDMPEMMLTRNDIRNLLAFLDTLR